MAKAAFLGLGVMGAPMAGHLAAKGHEVTVWNRTHAKADAWVGAHSGRAAPAVSRAIDGADFIFMCLGDDPDVEAVFGAFEPMLRDGQIVVDHTTASAALARRLAARCNARGADFLDAPVSGGEAGAKNGVLTVMCGGEARVFATAEPMMTAYARRCVLIGDAGAGQLAKSVNQICIAGVVQGLAEGLLFAEAAGLDAEKVIGAISGGAAQSWQMENRWKTMTADHYTHGFAVDWMRKDLRITLDAAHAAGLDLPLTQMVDEFYAEVQAMGGGRWDTSSLLKRLKARQTGE